MCFLHNKPREMSGLQAGWRTVRKDPTGKTPDYCGHEEVTELQEREE